MDIFERYTEEVIRCPGCNSDLRRVGVNRKLIQDIKYDNIDKRFVLQYGEEELLKCAKCNHSVDITYVGY